MNGWAAVFGEGQLAEQIGKMLEQSGVPIVRRSGLSVHAWSFDHPDADKLPPDDQTDHEMIMKSRDGLTPADRDASPPTDPVALSPTNCGANRPSPSDLTAETLPQVNLAVVVQDDWQPSFYYDAEELLRGAGVRWLSAYMTEGDGIVGPLSEPGVPGCSQCADMRRLTASPAGSWKHPVRSGEDAPDPFEAKSGREQADGSVDGQRLARTRIERIASIAAEETLRVLRGHQAQTRNHLILLDLQTLNSSRHAFLPDPACGICGAMADDSPEAAVIALQPNPKEDPGDDRIKRLDRTFCDKLLRDYVDPRTGLINELHEADETIFTAVFARLPMYGRDIIATGRSHSYEESAAMAVLEGLERYCGALARGRKTVIRDSYRRLAESAVDPLSLGLYTNEQYAMPDFPFEPYDPDQQINWVWGYSFLQERPVLVPEAAAYYGYARELVFETSNGNAIGNSLEEACLYAILEVAERDAFLITWYAKLSLPRLDPASAGDAALLDIMTQLRQKAGYDVHLFNMTMDTGIPGILAIARNMRKTGMNLLCATGAHLDPVRAARSAVRELAGALPTLNSMYGARQEELRRMMIDPDLVLRMEDHALLYGLPLAEQRLGFLFSPVGSPHERSDETLPLQRFDEAFPSLHRHPDLTDELNHLLLVFRELRLEVIIVNQTSLEIARNNLFAVKAIIPGMLPMTFGHRYRRLAGLSRMLEVPAKLGLARRRIDRAQLNPHPHPYP